MEGGGKWICLVGSGCGGRVFFVGGDGKCVGMCVFWFFVCFEFLEEVLIFFWGKCGGEEKLI